MSDYADGSMVVETDLDAEGFEAGSDKAIKAVDGLAQEMNDFIEKIKGSTSDAASNLREMGEAAAKASEQAAEAAQQTADAQSQAKESSTEATDGMAEGYSNLDQKIADTRAEIERLNAEIEEEQRLEEAWKSAIDRGVDKATDFMDKNGYSKMPEQYKSAVIDDFVQEELKANNLLNYIKDNDAFEAKKEEVKRLKDELDGLIAKQQEYNEAQLEAARETAKETETAPPSPSQNGPDSSDGDLPQPSPEETNEKTQSVNALAKSLEKLADKLKDAAVKAFQFVGKLNASVVRAFGNAAKSAASHVKSLASNIAKVSINAFAKGLSKATSKLKAFSSQTGKTNLNSNALVKSLTSIKRLLLTRIKRTFISSLFKDVTEGIQRLAKFSDAFNKTMSRIKNSATQLKGNIAAMVGNIITALEPIILKIISLLNTAITYLNQFFALLSGKSTYTAAKIGADDYASSTDKATKAQKKLNAELYNFDELNKQSDKTDSSSGSSSGGIQYETKPIDLPQGVQDWIKKLKEAWENGDWYGVGAVIAEGLNKALEVADDWINNKFRPWAVEWASRIGNIINGFVDNFNWELLGKTVADGINAVFDALETFLDTTKWLNLGQGIGRAIKSWFDNIEWDRLGRVFAKKWNTLTNVIKGIVTTPGIWESMGSSIATFIKNWFATIDVDAIADVVIAIFSGITEAINSFLSGDPFKGVPEKIYKAINRVIHEVEWEDLADALVSLFLYCIDQLRKIVANIDWEDVFENMRNMAVTIAYKLMDYIGSIDWGAVAETFAEGLNQLVGTINDIIGRPGLWEGIGTKIGDIVKKWFKRIDLDAIADIIINLFNGISTMIREFLDGNPFEGVADKISNAINRVLHEVRWDELFHNLGELFMKLLGVFLDVVNKIDWHAVGVAIGDFLASVDWVGVLAKVGAAIWNAFWGVIEGLFSTSGGRVFIALFLGIKALGLAFSMAKGYLALKAASFLLTSIIGPISTGLTTTLPTIISGAAGVLSTALSGLLGVVAVAGVTALGVMGVKLAHAQLELNDAVNNELRTGLDSYKKLYEEKGPEVAAQWAQTCYQIDTTSMSLYDGQRAVAQKIADLNHTTFDAITVDVQQAMDTYKALVASAGVDAANSWAQQAFNIQLSGNDIEMNAEQLGMALKAMASETGTDVSSLVQQACNGLQTTTSAATTAMENDVSTKMDSMAAKAEETVNDIGSKMPTGWDTTAQNTAATTAAMESDVTTKMDSIAAKTDSTMTEIGESIPTGFDGITQNVATATAAMELDITTRMDAIAAKISESMTGIGEGLQLSWDGVTQNIAAATTAIETDVSTKMTNIQTNISTTLTSVGTDVNTSMTTMSTGVSTTLNTITSNLSAKLTAAKTSIKSAFANIKSDVTSSLKNISTTVSSNTQQTTSNFVQKWRSVISPLKSALQTMLNGVRTAMNTMKNTTLTTINQIKVLPWSSIGTAIVQGIGQGVNGSWPWLESLVRQRAQQLLAEAKAALGIASPSKLFEVEIGENIGLGWAEGIDNTKGIVVNTIKNISDAIADEASDAEINANANVNVNGMTTVVNKLSDVAATFKEIANTLASIGGFKAPQVAEGTVAPYQINAAANAAQDDNGTDDEPKYLSSILTELQSLVEIVRSASNSNAVIKVLIDGREVFQTVIDENNRAIQRTGASPIRT